MSVGNEVEGKKADTGEPPVLYIDVFFPHGPTATVDIRALSSKLERTTSICLYHFPYGRSVL